MENTVKEIIDDLEYLFKNGEIGIEVSNPAYYQGSPYHFGKIVRLGVIWIQINRFSVR
ncbi:hypothetical protein [Bacillus cereus]|uniref:Uncharacterized protein n=1 Tax=Bacillus cereus VD048 TaxID=1053226 RepID=J8HRR8_BACCE|nr:hypothetical protein [Bacillus cereus]EJR27811.1 hypothetical protein IIG_04838 [Bacillus cereus VD048]